MLKETSELLKQFYDLDDEVFELSQEVMEDIKEKFDEIKEIREFNQYKVLKAMISVEKKLKKYMQMYLGLKMHLLDL